jgi:hypothetical protein
LAAWVVAGVCLVLAFFLWFADLRAPAAVSALAGIIAIVTGLVVRIRRRHPRSQGAANGRPQGQGPYVNVDCAPSDVFTRTLETTLEELREAAEEEKWEVRWQEFGEYQKRAETANLAEDYGRAIREYAKAISFLMEEGRHQKHRKTDDSTVEF